MMEIGDHMMKIGDHMMKIGDHMRSHDGKDNNGNIH